VLPIIIVAVIAIPLLVIAFAAMRRTKNEGEHPAGETDADRRRTEQEFAQAERYQEQWREEQHSQPHPHDPPS
jgi:hypothetical protein